MNANTTKASRNRGINDTFKELVAEVTLQSKYNELFKLQLRKMFIELNKDTANQLNEQKILLNELEAKLTNLEEKFLFGSSVKEDVYLKYKADLEPQILEKKCDIAGLESRLSNHEDFIGKAIEVCENISKHWEFGDPENRQRIQNVLFPEGLVIVPETGHI